MNRPPKLKRGTKFSSWRWWVPALYRNINPIGHAGRAIYLDSDQIVLADIAELWESLDPGYMLACVQNVDGNDYWKAPRTIIESGKQYRDKLQTSVMVMDCEACCWDFGKLAVQNTYANLMQGEWMDRSRVQELDPQWNRFGRCDDGTKLLHFSHVASQPWRSPKHPLTDMWRNELLATLRAGHLSQETLREEIARGHVHELHGDLAR